MDVYLFARRDDADEVIGSLHDGWSEFDALPADIQDAVDDQRVNPTWETRQLLDKLHRIGLDRLTGLGDRYGASKG